MPDAIRFLLWTVFVGQTDNSPRWVVSTETVVGALRTGLLIFACTALVEGVEATLYGIDQIDFGVADQAASSLIGTVGDFFRRWYKSYPVIADHYRPIDRP